MIYGGILALLLVGGLAPHSMDRYGLTSGTPLKYNADTSLDIYIQAASPGPHRESNWLPIPPNGPINVMVRVYQSRSP